jgi:hypothetical protein
MLSIDKLNEKGFTKGPHLIPHVSAHNALVLTHAKTAAQQRKELEELDFFCAKMRKRYQKQKAVETPKREHNEAYIYGAYGYPTYYPTPIYVPYYADPSACEYAQAGVESTGSCAADTCCSSVSLGACTGGAGMPGCAASCGGHESADGEYGSCGGGGGDGDGGGGCGGKVSSLVAALVVNRLLTESLVAVTRICIERAM